MIAQSLLLPTYLPYLYQPTTHVRHLTTYNLEVLHVQNNTFNQMDGSYQTNTTLLRTAAQNTDRAFCVGTIVSATATFVDYHPFHLQPLADWVRRSGDLVTGPATGQEHPKDRVLLGEGTRLNYRWVFPTISTNYSLTSATYHLAPELTLGVD